MHVNLCQFLCIDQRYHQYLLLKKFKRALYDFVGSEALQQIGTKKNKYVIKATIEFSLDKESAEEDNMEQAITPKGIKD